MKLNYKRTILVGFAFFLICAFWQAYDNTIPLILTNKFGMSQTWSGAIMALDNILALFLLPRCERVLVTQVDAAAEGADAFFPNLDAAPDWTAETVGEWQEENGLRFRYVDYVRRT